MTDFDADNFIRPGNPDSIVQAWMVGIILTGGIVVAVI
jgi:hypothetical protein